MDALAPPAVPLEAGLPPILEFTGPLSAELRSFLPCVYGLHVSGRMRRRAIRTYQGMREFYFFLGRDQVLEKPERRSEAIAAWTAFAGAERMDGRLPDYRARYGQALLPAEKPLLILRNDFVFRPGRTALPVLAPDLLGDLIAGLSPTYRIVYWRAGMLGASTPDLSVARQCSEVALFDDLADRFAPRFGLTELKLRLCAQARAQISAPGEAVDLASLFPGLLVAVFDPAGTDEAACPAARPATACLHRRTAPELLAAIPMLRSRAAPTPTDAVPAQGVIASGGIAHEA